MLAVVYRSRLIQGKEDCYQTCWRHISSYLAKHRGALGSCLHKDAEGYWVIYSRWPDRETKECSWPSEGEKKLPEEVLKWAELMKSCVEELQAPYYLDVVEDNL